MHAFVTKKAGVDKALAWSPAMQLKGCCCEDRSHARSKAVDLVFTIESPPEAQVQAKPPSKEFKIGQAVRLGLAAS